jgi:hypothetical protein
MFGALCLSDGVLCRHELWDAGDGVRRGTTAKNTDTLKSYSHGTYRFESYEWTWCEGGGAQKEQETSKYLDRLTVLKELFNVFINRAVSL